MKLTIKEYAKRCGVSHTTILKRMEKKKIKTSLGIGHSGKPCFFIDTDDHPIKDNHAGKPGAPRKVKK